MAHDLVEEQQVHVSTGQHDHGRPRCLDHAVEQRCDSHGPRRLDEVLRPFEEEGDGLRGVVVVDHHEVIDERLDDPEAEIGRTCDGDPVRDGRLRCDLAGRPRPSRFHVGGNRRGLDTDDPDVRTPFLDGHCDSGDQAAPADGDDHRLDVRHLFEHFETERSLPRHDRRIVEGVDEGPTRLAGEGHRVVRRLREGRSGEDDHGAVLTGCGDLRDRRVLRHEHGCRCCVVRCGECDPLSMVASRSRDDPSTARVGIEKGNGVHPPSDLERSGPLEVLSFQPDLRP